MKEIDYNKEYCHKCGNHNATIKGNYTCCPDCGEKWATIQHEEIKRSNDEA